MTRDPDSGKGRHTDYTRREVTRPGPHVSPSLDDTADESSFPGGKTPVEHLRARVDQVAEVVADHAAVIAERHDMPSSEAWARLVSRLDEMATRVAVCEDERKARAKWARIWTWAKGLGAGGVLAALTWAVVQIGNAGADRERTRARTAAHDQLVVDVRLLREAYAADHALLQLLIGKGFP